MSHPEEGMFHALLDGELTPDEAHTIEAHVAACASCTARLADARAIFDESNRLVDRLEMPDRTPSDSSAPVPIPLAPAKRRMSPQRIRTLAWAATILIAAGLGYTAADWRHRVPGQEQPITMNDRLATPPEASTVETFGQSRISETTPADPQLLEGAVETETVPAVGKQLRVGGEAAPAEDRAGRANEEPAAPAATPIDAVELQEAGAGVPSRGAVVGGAQVEARAARRDRVAQEAPEGERQRDQDALAANRPAPRAGAFRQRAVDSVTRQPVVTGFADDARREAEVDNAKAAPAAELRARVTPARTATLEEAVQVLNGAIRLVEGASLIRVEIAAPPDVPWAAAQSSLVRVVYQLEGAEVVLSQVRVDPTIDKVMAIAEKRAADAPAGAVAASPPPPQLAVGDTLFASEPAGGYRVWWLDGPRRLLSLSGPLGQEALQRILRRIR